MADSYHALEGHASPASQHVAATMHPGPKCAQLTPVHTSDISVRPVGRHQYMSACGMQVLPKANQVTSSSNHYRIDWWTVLAVLLLCTAVLVLRHLQSESNGQLFDTHTVAT